MNRIHHLLPASEAHGNPRVATSERLLLRALFDEALVAVDPMRIVPGALPPLPAAGRVIVVGAGKAAARMARAVESVWADALGDRLEGRVVTRYGHGEPTRRIHVAEAGHPVPDAAGQEAAEAILALAGSARCGDLVLCLISGGGSALLSLPIAGVAPAEKRRINAALLRSGAPIAEMNCVRRHLSAIKGGKLGAACGAADVLTLVISDVPGDDPAVVASGPTVELALAPQQALDILARHRIEIGEQTRRAVLGTLKASPNAPTGAREVQVIATAQAALERAARFARAQGLYPLVLGGSLEGESRDVALVHAGIARQIVQYAQPSSAPCVILSGGETTVTVRGEGRGGRNAEFLLALAIAARDLPTLHALACDTDGIDGVEDNAGAFVDPDTLGRAIASGVDPRAYLERNDAYGFFERLGDLIVTGPTRTNVNDFRALIVR
jgi:glycerate 2-kinase